MWSTTQGRRHLGGIIRHRLCSKYGASHLWNWFTFIETGYLYGPIGSYSDIPLASRACMITILPPATCSEDIFGLIQLHQGFYYCFLFRDYDLDLNPPLGIPIKKQTGIWDRDATHRTTSHPPAFGTDQRSGIAFLHSKQICHRDIKPQNAMLSGASAIEDDLRHEISKTRKWCRH